MKIKIIADKKDLGRFMAERGAETIRKAIARDGRATVIVATGASQFELLDALVAAPGIDWSKVTAFHLDEYVALPATHGASFRRYLHERFVSKLPALKEFVEVEGDAADLKGEISRLNARLRGLKVAVCFAGIGENGHLAFNDPPADFETRDAYLTVDLDEACRRQQLGEGWFPTLEDVPTRAVSMSVRQIMASEQLLITVPDLRKAAAVRNAIEGPLTNMCPASILRLHPDCLIGLDPVVIDLERAAMTTTAGLFDLQVNGFAGVDFNDPGLTPERFDQASRALVATGVTQFLPTLITASEASLAARFKALDAAVSASPLARTMVPGYHLEGPFLNPAPGFCGCHPAADMMPPDIALVDRLAAGLSRPILLVTIAPELPGSLDFIKQVRRRGIAVALGHSDARAQTAREAVEAGATLATHLGNGVAHQMHKFDNPIIAQATEDGLWGCFIVDGIHVSLPGLRMLTRTKTLARSILVTDAVAAAGAPPGRYLLAGMAVERGEDGTVRQNGASHLAGSSLTMDQGVRNLVRWGLCSFDEAIRLGSANPRKALEECGMKVVDPGRVEWSDDHRVTGVRLDGGIVFQAP